MQVFQTYSSCTQFDRETGKSDPEHIFKLLFVLFIICIIYYLYYLLFVLFIICIIYHLYYLLFVLVIICIIYYFTRNTGASCPILQELFLLLRK